MQYAIDVAHQSINKYGEELCGDHVEVIHLPDCVYIVLSDGLGSGVKANILATLTSKIAVTMLKEGSTLEDTIDTIVHTLPECSVRKLAYSTFTIIRADLDGGVYVAEFDNPSFFLLENGKPRKVIKNQLIMNDKKIYETQFRMNETDLLTIVSDGVIHAGVGKLLNLGWQWDNVNDFLQSVAIKEKSASSIAKHLLSVCENLYEDRPGDDATVVALKLKLPDIVNLFTGPPAKKQDDKQLIDYLLKAGGTTVISGGTTANIVSRELAIPIEVDMTTYTKEVPPIATMQGITLVTEGVLTLNKTIELLKEYLSPLCNKDILTKLKEHNGAAMLARLLIDDCTHLNIWLGKAINPAHQNPNFPMGFNIKVKLILEMMELLKQLGKEVHLSYL